MLSKAGMANRGLRPQSALWLGLEYDILFDGNLNFCAWLTKTVNII